MNSVLTTIASRDYIDAAKQLFSSAYFNGGWAGDFLLLTYQVPTGELKWFIDRGIKVKDCQSLFNRPIGIRRRSPATLNKFYLFIPEFKKWDTVIYLDADTIVRASLERLKNVKGFWAVGRGWPLKRLFAATQPALIKELGQKYNLQAEKFDTTVMAFSTDIIEDTMFDQLKSLFNKYESINQGGDEDALNLYFYQQWQLLPQVYAVPFNYLTKHCGVAPGKIDGIIIHHTQKPWQPNHYAFEEWRKNLHQAEKIDLKKSVQPNRVWSQEEIKTADYFINRQLHSFKAKLDAAAGIAGRYLKHRWPRAYKFLR